MPELVKETKLFPGNRRKLELNAIELLPGRGEGEKRLKLGVSMPLSGEPLVAMPDWIGDTYEVVLEADTALKRAVLDRYYEAMTVEVFSTDKIKRRTLVLTGVTLRKFVVERVGSEDKSDVVLTFLMYLSMNVQAWEWCKDVIGYTFFASFESAQTEMSFAGNEKTDASAAQTPSQPVLIEPDEDDADDDAEDLGANDAAEVLTMQAAEEMPERKKAEKRERNGTARKR